VIVDGKEPFWMVVLTLIILMSMLSPIFNSKCLYAQQSSEELVKNGDFSSGLLNWSVNNSELFSVKPFTEDRHHTKYNDLVLEFRVDASKPSGTYYGSLSQSLYLPKAETATLSFTYFDSSAGREVSSIRIRIIGYTTNLTELSNWLTLDGYAFQIHTLNYDITSLSGQNITLIIELRVDQM
jgi:hypothetical protein